MFRELNEQERELVTKHRQRNVDGFVIPGRARLQYVKTGRFTQVNVLIDSRIRFTGASYRSRQDKIDRPFVGELNALHRALVNGWIVYPRGGRS